MILLAFARSIIASSPALEPPPCAPSLAIRALQALLARLEAVDADLRRERNRQEKTEATPMPVTVFDALHHHIAFLEQEQTRSPAATDDHLDRHPNLKRDRDLLRSIPAVAIKPPIDCWPCCGAARSSRSIR